MKQQWTAELVSHFRWWNPPRIGAAPCIGAAVDELGLLRKKLKCADGKISALKAKVVEKSEMIIALRQKNVRLQEKLAKA